MFRSCLLVVKGEEQSLSRSTGSDGPEDKADLQDTCLLPDLQDTCLLHRTFNPTTKKNQKDLDLVSVFPAGEPQEAAEFIADSPATATRGHDRQMDRQKDEQTAGTDIQTDSQTDVLHSLLPC